MDDRVGVQLLSQLDREKLIAVIGWMAKELSEWIASESVESGWGNAKNRTPEELIADAVAAAGTDRSDHA